MATNLKNFSKFSPDESFKNENFKVGLVVSEWNSDITGKLLEGSLNILKKQGIKDENITIIHVPGSLELTSGARLLTLKKRPDGIICIGCVIKGETQHFDYVCQGTTNGITLLNATFDIPFIFCVLTVNNIQQAFDRAGGKYGNKGEESAIALLKMINLKKTL